MLKEILDRTEAFIDPFTGIIKHIYQVENLNTDPAIFNFATEVADASRFSSLPNFMRCGGAAFDYYGAKLAAIGETIERYCSSIYSKANFTYASFNGLKEEALSPQALSLFSDEQYGSPGFPYKKFTSDTKAAWVWGYSLLKQKPILVPAALVYVPYLFNQDEPPISFSSSSGMAFGSSVHQAILSGIYELIERDGVMIMWLNSLSMPQLNLDEGLPPALRDLLENKFRYWKTKLKVVDITTDLGIPTFFSTMVNEDDNNNPKLAVGAACRLDPAEAFSKSIVECAQTMVWARYLMKKFRAYEFKPDFSDIESFDQHVLLYSRPQMFSAFDFVMQSPVRVSFDKFKNRSSGDSRQDLTFCLKVLGEQLNEIIYVDLTTPEVKEEGFCVVKVIIPELVALGVGVKNLFLGSKRLLDIPRKLGYETKKINSAPHPFP